MNIHDIRVNPIGPKDANIMVLGESPGREEVAKGKPFIGDSGQEQDKIWKEEFMPGYLKLADKYEKKGIAHYKLRQAA